LALSRWDDGQSLGTLAPSKTGPSRTADRVVVLAEGQIIEDGPPGQVLDEPQMPRTQQFLSQMLI